jgi:hypothetical protein
MKIVRIFIFLILLMILSGCSSNPQTSEVKLFFTLDLNGRIDPCGCKHDREGGLARRAWVIQQYKDQNGFLPHQVELGNSSSSYNESKWEITKAIYSILEKLGTEAILLKDQELKDQNDLFIKRLDSPLSHVLSNVYPKDTKSDFAELKQYYTTGLGNGRKLYFLNICDIEKISKSRVISENYNLIEPIEFLEKFVKQIHRDDIVIARYNITYMKPLDAILSSKAAKRVDLNIVPDNESTKFLTEDEKELGNLLTGWNPKLEKSTKETESPEEESDQVTAEDTEDTEQPVVESGDQQTSSTSLTREQIKANIEKRIAESTKQESETVEVEEEKEIEEESPSDKLPPDFRIENREFMEIKNEYHVIPEPRTGRYIREVHLKKDAQGGISIKVSDITMEIDYPEDKEIATLAKDIHSREKEEVEKNTFLARIENIQTQIGTSGDNPYTGISKCQECHKEAYKTWTSSKHANALESLGKKGSASNQDCLKCHLTTWSQPPYYKSEWTFDKFGSELGCEACHGPGLAHIRLMQFAMTDTNHKYWSDIKEKEPALLTENISTKSKEMCMDCHDIKNSPDFDFVKYWEKIVHKQPEVENPLPDLIIRLRQEKSTILVPEENAVSEDVKGVSGK